MSFRRKIFISYLVIFLILTALLYPIAAALLKNIQEKNLRKQTVDLVDKIKYATNLDNLIEQLKQREKFLLFRVSLLTPQGEYLYDSHSHVEGFTHQKGKEQPELTQAVADENGTGYHVRYSPIFDQEMTYVAVPFDFQGLHLFLRTAFAYTQIAELTHDLTLAFLYLSIGVLLLYSVLAWFVIHYLTKPVHQIIQAIKPFQLGKAEHIPRIELGRPIRPQDEFGQLAETLNALSLRIEHQISNLTQEKNEKSAILESLVEGVVAVDQHMQVIYMNKTAEIFLGIEEKKLIGKSFQLAHQVRCEDLILEAQQLKRPVLHVLKPERKQKRFLDAVAIPRGQGEGAILVLQDKTSLHKLVELGRDFVANASHELKTPITIIRGFAETLHDHPELSKEVSHEITEKIVSNCQRMDTLVKNLLTLAAIDEGLPRSRLQECDIVDLAEEARQTILAVHPHAEINIETKGIEPFHLMLDSDLFVQAILNLLDNAVKYSKAPAHVTIKIFKKPKEFILQVSDKGIGIPSEDLDRIFERFYAVDKSHSRSLGGSGLGLSIVERIVDKHHGKIDVTSQLNEGTTFTITLPVQEDDHF